MKILALVSQKGGAGKSLISAHLAVAFEETGIKVMAIDLDRQGSLRQWGLSRRSVSPKVIGNAIERLALTLDGARRDFDLVIIDTPPHSDKNALGAISIADLVLMPIRPAIFDLRAIKETIEIVEMAKKKGRAVVVLNAVPTHKVIGDEAEEAARQYGVDVAPVRLTERAAFAHALTAGYGITEYDPKSKAATEILALRSFVASRLNIKAKR